VAMCNYAYKNFSGTYTTSLIILGQLSLAIIIDRMFGITIGLKEIIGIVLIASGIAYNSYINREKSEKVEGILIK
jgi:drug/metabolite transporter (DMT)-like permease